MRCATGAFSTVAMKANESARGLTSLHALMWACSVSPSWASRRVNNQRSPRLTVFATQSSPLVRTRRSVAFGPTSVLTLVSLTFPSKWSGSASSISAVKTTLRVKSDGLNCCGSGGSPRHWQAAAR